MLVGEKTRLRCVEMSDLDNCLAWINDLEVTRFLATRMQVSRKQEEQWLSRMAAGDDGANKVFAIETLDGQQIGNTGLHGIDYISGFAEIGIVIGMKQYWGKGYGTDAMRTLMRFAFRELGLRKITLKVFGTNTRAQKAYAKLGFREVGRFRAHVLKDGMYEDEILMEVFAEDLK